jgi:hypothetical protein
MKRRKIALIGEMKLLGDIQERREKESVVERTGDSTCSS